MAQRRKDGGNRHRIAQGVRPAHEPAPMTATSGSPRPRPSAAAKSKTKKVVTASARKKAPVKKAAVKKTVVKKAAAKKPPAKKTPVKKPAVKKTAAKKPAVKRADVKSAKAKQPVPKKTAAKTAPAKKIAVKQPPAKKTATTTGVPGKTAAKKVAVKKPARLVVRADEKPWTAEELAEVRGTLEAERDRLRNEISSAESELNELLRDSGDGSGDDQADAGSKTFEREHEMSVANNSRDLLMQVEHALARIGDGSYGTCESCGQPIGKARLQVFPRATLCVTCKQREERR